MKTDYKITVVTVTYGKRWHLLSQVLNSVKNNPLVAEIVVVNNGSKEDIENLCKTFNSDKIFVISTEKNLGSAGGFKLGIEAAYKRNKGELIFLLDDDNVVEKDCLECLIETYKKLGSTPNNCLKAYKYNNKSDILLAEKGYLYFDNEDSFFNFNLIDRLFLLRNIKTIRHENIIPVRGVAYSGFLFHRMWIQKIGLPDENMILYGDDTEYTLRLINNGGGIYLCINCKIRDLEMSWHHQNFKSVPFFSINSDFIRSSYGIRNRAYVEKKYLIKNKYVYYLNFLIFTFYHVLRAFLFEKEKNKILKRIITFFKLIKKGWRGELGYIHNLDDL